MIGQYGDPNDATPWLWTTGTVSSWPPTMNASALCPDLLRYEQIGQADTLRGRVVRLFFWVLRAWPP